MNDDYLLQGSDRCKCSACGDYFVSELSFEAHRRGKPSTGRRCADHKEKARATSLFPGLLEKEPGVWGFLYTNKEGVQ